MNLCFSSGVFPTACKPSIMFPLIKKQGLEFIEKAIATQIHDQLINNDIVDNFQSAYKAGRSQL